MAYILCQGRFDTSASKNLSYFSEFIIVYGSLQAAPSDSYSEAYSCPEATLPQLHVESCILSPQQGFVVSISFIEKHLSNTSQTKSAEFLMLFFISTNIRVWNKLQSMRPQLCMINSARR